MPSIHTFKLWDFLTSLTGTTIFFLFCPRWNDYFALFLFLSLVMIVIFDCNVQFISQIFLIMNANESPIFICLPKMAFWWSPFCPHVGNWRLLKSCQEKCIKKQNKWMQQIESRREEDLYQPEKKYFWRTENFQKFLKTGVRFSSATTLNSKLKSFIAISSSVWELFL